jgi:3',5'-cyclic AMP phosphodiesterase CpdA
MLDFRFAIISDLHISLPHRIWDSPNRFHLVEVSIPALELVLEQLTSMDLDFLLLPGDLTQHGERENHQWLSQRLASLPFPVYVVPGNHDVPSLLSTETAIAWRDFPYFYQKYGYRNPEQFYYSQEILPGIQLIGLNSNQFDASGNQIGCLDREQLLWLEATLNDLKDRLVLVTIHHNIIEHLPGQSNHAMGKRYMLDNAPVLLNLLKKYGVKLVFTGHLHVQDIARQDGIYEITTGSLVSYPHPYRILHFYSDHLGQQYLEIESFKIKSLPGWDDLCHFSREWMGDRSYPFMMKLLTCAPLNLTTARAELLAPKLRYFWADIANGDGYFDFPDFPPLVRNYFKKFSAMYNNGEGCAIDNKAILEL